MQRRISHQALLTCGIFASLTYVATDVSASLRYPGYDFIDQAVSELFAIGAPVNGRRSTAINSGRRCLPSFCCVKGGR